MPLPPNVISSASASSAAGLAAGSAANSDANQPGDPASAPGLHAGGTGEPHPGLHWLRRADLFLRVIVRLYVGLILIFLPWTRVWAPPTSSSTAAATSAEICESAIHSSNEGSRASR